MYIAGILKVCFWWHVTLQPCRRWDFCCHRAWIVKVGGVWGGVGWGEVAIPSIRGPLDLRKVVRTLVVNAAASYTFLLRYASKSWATEWRSGIYELMWTCHVHATVMHCVDTSGVGWGGLITSMYACTSAQCYVDVTFLHACTSTQCYFDATSMHRGVATFGPPHTYIHTYIHYIALHYITLHTYIYIYILNILYTCF